MIDVAGLRVIDAIAEHGSFTAAAGALGYSQPAISQMVRRLEDRLGTPLVERLGRSVRLTDAGRALAAHAAPILASMAAAEAEMVAIAGLRAGRVRLVAFPSASSVLVPQALGLVKANHPDLEVSFAEAEPPEAIADLRAGHCDIAVAFSYPDVDSGTGEDLAGLAVRELLQEQVMVALPASHPLAGSELISLADLADEPWIAGCPRCRSNLLHLAGSAGFSPRVAFETEDYMAVIGLVAAGLGAALVPELIHASLTTPEVVVRPMTPASIRSVFAITSPDLLRVPAVEATMDALEQIAGELSADTVLNLEPSTAGHRSTR